MAKQINRAYKIAQRLGKRHGVYYGLISLSVEQHGAAQPFTSAQLAALVVGEGVYLLAQLAEYPQCVPASSPKRGRTIARQLSHRLRSSDADRPSIFFAHALVRYGEFSYQELGDEGSERAMTRGRAILAAHYPLSAVDAERLEDCCVRFREPAMPGIDLSPFSIAAPDFVGKTTAYAIGLLLGNRVVAQSDFASIWPMPDPYGVGQLIGLTQIWADHVAKNARLLGSH